MKLQTKTNKEWTTKNEYEWKHLRYSLTVGETDKHLFTHYIFLVCFFI